MSHHPGFRPGESRYAQTVPNAAFGMPAGESGLSEHARYAEQNAPRLHDP